MALEVKLDRDLGCHDYAPILTGWLEAPVRQGLAGSALQPEHIFGDLSTQHGAGHIALLVDIHQHGDDDSAPNAPNKILRSLDSRLNDRLGWRE